MASEALALIRTKFDALKCYGAALLMGIMTTRLMGSVGARQFEHDCDGK